jgi:hypothetical protein
MVYKLYLDGESVDAQYGQPVTFVKTFIGKYGRALMKADELLKLIDFGTVTVLENGLKERKPVYIATKDFARVSKIEIN